MCACFQEQISYGVFQHMSQMFFCVKCFTLQMQMFPISDSSSLSIETLHVSLFRCKCDAGFENRKSALDSGLWCTEAIDVCRPNPCFNRGMCVQMPRGERKWSVDLTSLPNTTRLIKKAALLIGKLLY